jgi:hypothetical protein
MSISEKRPWYSSLLFARPSWLSGAARLFDWGASLNEYNRSSTPDEADFVALASDWCAIGGDVRRSMNECDEWPLGEQRDGDEAASGQIKCPTAGSRR